MKKHLIFLLLSFFIFSFSNNFLQALSITDTENQEILIEEITPTPTITPTIYTNPILETETIEVELLKIISTEEIQITIDQKEILYELSLKIISGSQKDKIIELKTPLLQSIKDYRIGEHYIVERTKIGDSETYVLNNVVRRQGLIWLFVLFILITVIIAQKKGIYSLLGLISSFLVIFYFLLPQIMNGMNPVLTAILASTIIIPINFYLSHGFSQKTTIAVISTIISLIVVGLLAILFSDLTLLSGSTSDEIGFLKLIPNMDLNIKGLLLAGIIIGTVGILDDITISQAAIAFELKHTSPNLKFIEIYKKTMNIGKDHIASLVNTLILVYTGASLPLLLLFTNSKESFDIFINFEPLAEEIVRTLVSSIGLILAVPITTFISCYYLTKKKNLVIDHDDIDHGHVH